MRHRELELSRERRLATLELEVQERRVAHEEEVEHREPVRAMADSLMLILFVRNGPGVFPQLERW